MSSFSAKRARQRRTPIGADVDDEGVHFRLWAPRCQTVALVIWEGNKIRKEIALEEEENGYFSRQVSQAVAGTRYSFRPDQDSQTYPDPASLFQPDGVHKPSQVID